MDVQELRALLLSYKHKTRSFEWRVGTPMIQGQWNEQVTGDMNFFVDGEMVHVTESKNSENFVVPLLEGIKKLDDVLKNKRA